MSNAERVARYKEKMTAQGLAQVNLWLPVRAIPDFKQAAEAIGADPQLSIRLWNTKTGRTVKGQ
jgi:hypothetical protein